MEDRIANTTNGERIKKGRQKVLISYVVIILIVAALAVTLILVIKENSNLRNNPQQAVTEQADALRNKVSSIMQLPNETPTVATVNDAETLKQQPFFTDVINDDKVLIFSGAQKVVIYRESENKIINSGPINISSGINGTVGRPTEIPEPENANAQ
jgi:cytoskeletal protein RodZ